ncbi:CDP-alcohol phosphatidyltransferase family protein [Parabacteroides sp.]
MSKENIQSTYKSNDTEEWLDRIWTRPIGYQWALLFQRLNIHPNTVTILSMIIGASSALFFAHGSYRTEGMNGLLLNVVAILLLAWANFYDSADGQLARMTGKKTRLGRILDGAASEVWFIPIYLSLVYRFYVHHDMEFQFLGIENNVQNTWIATLMLLAIVLYSGFGCHSRQCGLADYYRQIHLFFLKGEAGSELDNSVQQQKLYDETPWKGNFLWKAFLKTYVNYTRGQEAQTPQFQRLMKKLRERYGATENIPQAFRDRFRALSLPLMKWTNILTFNTRAIVLYVVCLVDLPWLYFFFEVFLMTALCQYMRRKHEMICKQLYDTVV